MADVLSFITPIAIVIEILVADFLFALRFNRRNWFWLSFIGYGIGSIIITVWTEIAYVLITEQGFIYGAGVSNLSDSVFKFLFYFSIFVMTIACVFFSYKESLPQVLFCCSGAYATQHIARNISLLIGLIPIFSYGKWSTLFYLLMSGVVYVAVYLSVYFLFIRCHSTNAIYNGNNIRKVILSLTVIVVCIGMSRLTNDVAQKSMLFTVAGAIYAILSCMLVLNSQFEMTANDSMHYEVASMSELLRQERKQYELSKETIDLINIKCHDLKHQISALRKDASEENISEIEHAIMIYDSAVKTGNDVLDVILTEKKLLCESKNIQMTCMVKGELVEFMDKMDVYSLFGNALSNAIESVSRLPDENDRCIGIVVRNIGAMLIIHVENCFDGKLKIENGLPVTIKNDRGYHGFGMKSMQRVAEKYGGEMNVAAKENKFNLDILIPLKGKNIVDN